MIGNYQYRALSEAEVKARRQRLDSAGRIVVLTQLGVLLLVFTYRYFTRRPGAYKRSGLVRALRRWEWRLAAPIAVTIPQARCAGDWLAVFTWLAYCVGLAMWKTGDDYLHLTKAFAIVAAANMPMQFLMAMKRSPLRWVLGVSYEGKSNFIHRWLGRIVYSLLVMHVSLYLKFFWDTNRMTTRLLEHDVLWGVGGFYVLSMLVISANHLFRNLSYRTFYVFHIFLASALFPTLFLHVSHLRVYLAVAFFCFAIDYATRFYLRFKANATLRKLAPGLMEITIDPGDQASLRHSVTIAPGVHGLLRVPQVSAWTWNPFTFTTSTISPDGEATSPEKKPWKLVARARNGFTKRLANLQATTPTKIPAMLDMSYGASQFFDLQKFDKILFVAGGVGATFAVSWVKYLLKNKVSTDKLRFVWAVKTTAEAEWALEDDYDGDAAHELAGMVEIYLTGTTSDATVQRDEDEEDAGEHEAEDDNEVEMRLLNDSNTPEHNVEALLRRSASKSNIHYGRPDLKRLVEDTVQGGGSVAVLMSGPDRMASEMKRIVARKASNADDSTEFWLHVEEFGH